MIREPETLTICVGVCVRRFEKLYQAGIKGRQMDRRAEFICKMEIMPAS